MHRSMVSALVFGMFLWGLPASAQQPVAPQVLPAKVVKVKVVYLYKFSRYVAWPKTAFKNDSSPFEIGIVGPNSVASLLKRVAKTKKVNGRKMVIREFASPDKYEPCHIVFVSDKNAVQIAEKMRTATQGKPTLVVADHGQFAANGGSVNFFLDADGTLGLKINIDNLKRRKLVVDAKLLKVADVVRDGQQAAKPRAGALK